VNISCLQVLITLGLSLGLLDVGCGSSGNPTHSLPPTAACVPAATPEYSYALTGYAVSMFTVNSCTGQFSAAKPTPIATGYALPQARSEEMVVDARGRFAYVANPVSNVSDLSTISMYTIDPATGILSPTTPATVHTGWYPQEIAIDPQGRFVYTANSDDSTVSMFTVNQTTGVLTPTKPASISTLVAGELLSQPSFLTVDPTGKFLYVTASLSDGAAVFMYSIDQTTGLLTPTSPARVFTGGIPFQVVIAPNGKFAYVVNNLSDPGTPNGVWQFIRDQSSGVLTPNPTAAAAAGNGPTGVAVDPSGRFAYVVNRQDNTVSMFTIDPASGSLALNATTAYPTGTVTTGALPFRIAFDPSGKFVYVTNEDSAASVYTVNEDGTLTNIGSTGVTTGAVATAITAVP